MVYVVKRDGTKEQFNRKKIERAMEKAFIQVEGELDSYDVAKITNIADYIENKSKDEELTVENIQDLVVAGLKNTKKQKVLESYIIYRNDRTRVRNNKSELIKNVGKKLTCSNIENQNANVDEHSFGGRRGEAANIIMKDYALNNIMSEMSKYNHINNIIYVHDLDSYALGMHNCLSVPFDDLLAHGFNTRQTDVRPANSINTAFQLVAVIFQLQSLQQFGGVSATHLDWTMVPYFRKSFMKHYIAAYIKRTAAFAEIDLEEMLFDDYEENIEGHIILRNKFEDWVDENKEKCLKELGLTKEDFTLDNKDKFDPLLYQCALYDTITETKQAVEGMYHNLNTLQSRSGRYLIAC